MVAPGGGRREEGGGRREDEEEDEEGVEAPAPGPGRPWRVIAARSTTL